MDARLVKALSDALSDDVNAQIEMMDHLLEVHGPG